MIFRTFVIFTAMVACANAGLIVTDSLNITRYDESTGALLNVFEQRFGAPWANG